jgi:hypothetical protein
MTCAIRPTTLRWTWCSTTAAVCRPVVRSTSTVYLPQRAGRVMAVCCIRTSGISFRSISAALRRVGASADRAGPRRSGSQHSKAMSTTSASARSAGDAPAAGRLRRHAARQQRQRQLLPRQRVSRGGAAARLQLLDAGDRRQWQLALPVPGPQRCGQPPALQAFALSHEPSPWMGERQTLQLMPEAQADGVPLLDRAARSLSFSHDHETARADGYRVAFDNGIVTEMTPTDHAAMFRFTFTGAVRNWCSTITSTTRAASRSIRRRSFSGYSDVKSRLSAGADPLFLLRHGRSTGAAQRPTDRRGARPRRRMARLRHAQARRP